MTARVSLFVLGLLAAPAVGAQQLQPAAPQHVSKDSTPTSFRSSATSVALGITGRSVLGGIGSFGGAVLGASMGNATASSHHDLDALGPVLVGAAIGSALGASAFAAAPRLGSRCNRATCFGLSLLGSTGGGVMGAIAASHSRSGDGVFGYMGGTAIGAALAASVCG